MFYSLKATFGNKKYFCIIESNTVQIKMTNSLTLHLLAALG